MTSNSIFLLRIHFLAVSIFLDSVLGPTVKEKETLEIWVPVNPLHKYSGGIAGTQIWNGSKSVTVGPRTLVKKRKWLKNQFWIDWWYCKWSKSKSRSKSLLKIAISEHLFDLELCSKSRNGLKLNFSSKNTFLIIFILWTRWGLTVTEIEPFRVMT